MLHVCVHLIEIVKECVCSSYVSVCVCYRTSSVVVVAKLVCVLRSHAQRVATIVKRRGFVGAEVEEEEEVRGRYLGM